MPTDYRIVLKTDNSQSDAAMRKSLALMREYERECLKAAKAASGIHAYAAGSGSGTSGSGSAASSRAAGGKGQPIDIGLHKLQIDTIKGQDKIRASKEKHAASVSALESKYLVKDYQARVKAEAQKQKINDLARSRTEKGIKDLEGLEESYRVRDYKSRVAIERRKEAAEEKAVQARNKASEKAAAASQKQVEKEAANYDKIQLRKVRADDRAADQILARQKQAAAAKERLEAGPAAKQATFRRRELTEEQAHAAALVRITDVRNKRRIESSAKAMGEERLSFAEAIHSALGLESAFTKVAIAGAAIGAVTGIARAVASAMSDARAASASMAREVLDTAAALREIAMIKGKFAPDEEDTARHLALRVASGLTKGEAVTYEAELQNQLGTVGKDRFSEAERDKLTIEGAKMAARGGGGESAVRARATMHGLLPGYVKPDAKTGKVMAKDVTAMADAVDVINNMGAASNAVSTAQSASLLTSLTTPDMVGTFHDPRQAVALSTIASQFDKEASATAAMEAIRQARGFTKLRKGKGADAAQGETLKAAGINEQMNPAQSMTKLFEYAKQEMKPDEAFDAFMARKGFRDQTGNQRLAQFYATYQKGEFQRIMAEADKPLDAKATDVKAKAFAASDVGRDLIGAARVDVAKHKQGLVGKELELQKRPGEEQFIAEGGDTTTLGQIGARLAGLGNADAGRKAMIERNAVAQAQAAAGQTPTGLGMLGRSAQFIGGTMFGPAVGRQVGTAASYFGNENAATINYLKEIADSNKKIAASNEQMAADAKARAPQIVPRKLAVDGPAVRPARP